MNSAPLAEPADAAEPTEIVRTVSPRDLLYPVYAATYGAEAYFKSGRQQVDAIAAYLERYTGDTLAELRCIGDYACHYGRLLRWLRVRAPEATLIAYDIDPEAVRFCSDHFGAVPVRTDWNMMTAAPAPGAQELLICSSLLTHTSEVFARRALAIWERMLTPGGLLVFTYLGGALAEAWASGDLPHYGTYPGGERERVLNDLAHRGHAFAGRPTPFSTRGEYGIGFLTDHRVGALVAEAGLELRELTPASGNVFGQDVAVTTKRGGPA